MESVNGQYCRDCTEIARAKRGEDAHRKPELAGPKELLATLGQPWLRAEQFAVAAHAQPEALGVNRPVAGVPTGSRLNLYA